MGRQKKSQSFLKKFWKKLEKPQVIDREYIEGETADEISYVNYSDLPDKAERPLPYIPESHQPEYGKKSKKDKRRAA